MARIIRKAKQSMDSSVGASKRQKVESPLKPGDEVVFHNLKTNVNLNGKSGKLIEYDSDVERWEVRTEFDICIAGVNDKVVNVKEENLKRKKVESPLKPGDQVVFHNLKTNVNLNGKSGKLIEYDSDEERWEVRTEFDVCIAGFNDKVVNAKEENLKRKEVAAADREPNMSCPTHVYVLMLEEWHHGWGGGWAEDAEVIGVYISKEAAASAAGDINTSYGTFDEAIDPESGTFSDEFDHEDNRSDPPDDGILIQIGGKDIGTGDYVRLTIQKKPLL